MYGDKFFFNPELDKPVLSIIDSGTTLVQIPLNSYNGLMKSITHKYKNDNETDFLCSKDSHGNLDACWFNNTRCLDIHDKLEPMRFIFGNTVFEIKVQAFLKDIHPDGYDESKPPEKPKDGSRYTGGCMFELRPATD